MVPYLESNNLEVHPLIGDGKVLLEEVKTFLANWMSATRVCGSAVVQRVRKESLFFPACLRCLSTSSQSTSHLLDKFPPLKCLVAVNLPVSS
jgi:hypothetical protein